MVSVIVPVYNVEGYIDKCVQSIINQTYTDLEILLIDDGSSDHSGDLCKMWQKRDIRIRYFCRANEGLGPTRNFGVCLARGEFLSFVDPDDWIEDNFIQTMVDSIGNADLVFCDYKLIRSGSVLTGRRYCNLERPIAMKEFPRMLYTMGASSCNKLYRREFWQKHAPPQPAHAYEDTASMPALCIHANKIVQVRRPLYNYRIDRPESITNISPKLSEMFQAIEEVKCSFEENGLAECYRPYLEKYCAMALGVPLSRMQEDGEGKRRACAQYYQLFPYAEKLDSVRVLVLGSGHAEYTLSKARFWQSAAESINWQQDWKRVLTDTDAQLVLFDLTGEFVPNPGQLAEALEKKAIPACGLSGRWSMGFGLYGPEQPFLQAEAIRAHNRLADTCRKELRERLPTIKWLDCESFDFTDSEFALGCHPCYKNNYFYYALAEQMWTLLGALYE